MAAGNPVIITRVGEAMNWLQYGQNAIIVDLNDVRVLANAIATAFANIDSIRKIGEAGSIVAREKFDYRAYSSILKEFFKELSTQ